MRLATWNIGGGLTYSEETNDYTDHNIQYVIDQLRSIAPDIICLQESHISELENQPELIANELGMKFFESHIIADSHIIDNSELAISIISRFPIKSAAFRQLTNPNLTFTWRGKPAWSHDKGFVDCTLNHEGKDIRVLSGHMVPFRKFGKSFLDDEFSIIRKEICSIIQDNDLPLLVGVDMNFNGKAEDLLPLIFEQGFKQVLPKEPTTPKGRSYDKIIVSRHWGSKDSTIVPCITDHYLCYSDLELL